ncbi:MAG TPA: TonB-dependent siderophore receptor [Methylophilaceae bacterium]|nr:TonB-dependent siderophore receptor [Methylophilaceae bacterium]
MITFKTKPVWLAVMLALSTSSLVAKAEEPTVPEKTLPEVDVSASKIQPSQDVEGYLARGTRTATKTETLLKDVPQSISIVTEEQIEDQAIRSVEDAVRYVPGVQATQGEGNRDAVVFRGNQTTADFFVNGVRDDVQYYRDFYNVERVEVLKGPNGMIFGRGGSGGVFNRVTKEATFDPVRELTLQVGSYDQRRAAIDIGQAISESAAFRLNAVAEDADSYRDGVSLRRHGINPTITFLPSDKTKIVLSAEYFTDHRTADRGIPSFRGRPFRTDESTFFGNADLSEAEAEVQNYSALVEHEFDNGVTLRNRTWFADYDKYYQNVFASSSVNNAGNYTVGAYRDDTQRENLFNQTDLIFSLDTGGIEHKLLTGVEIGRQDTDSLRLNPTFGAGTSISARNPTYRGPVSFNVVGNDRSSEVDVLGLYVQDQIVLSSKLEAVLGLRYDKFETNYKDHVSGQGIDADDEFVSPRAGLIFKPVETVSLYTSYSMAYVPRAGEQLTSLTVTNATFDPEEFKNYEIGAKWDVTSSLALTAAVFRLERENVAIADPGNPTNTILIDGQETEGFELGVAGYITPVWSIYGGYTYQEAKVTEDQSATITEGNRLANTPEQTLSLWNRYDINQMWSVALGIVSREHSYAAADNTVELPGYTRVDAAAYARLDKNLRLQLNIENLLDKEYYVHAHNNNNITPGSPIAGRATLIYDF